MSAYWLERLASQAEDLLADARAESAEAVGSPARGELQVGVIDLANAVRAFKRALATAQKDAPSRVGGQR